MKFAKYRCKEMEYFRPAGKKHPCGKVFIAMSDRHRMDHCPNHEETYVDMEEDYVRKTLTAEFVEAFEPPWFDDEDDYHSALMSWLNDSDEEFELLKPENRILYVVRVGSDVVNVLPERSSQVSKGSVIDKYADAMYADAMYLNGKMVPAGKYRQREKHEHDWRLVCCGQLGDTFECYTCRKTKQEGFTPCASERPNRKTICQGNKGHTGSHHAVIYWE